VPILVHLPLTWDIPETHGEGSNGIEHRDAVGNVTKSHQVWFLSHLCASKYCARCRDVDIVRSVFWGDWRRFGSPASGCSGSSKPRCLCSCSALRAVVLPFGVVLVGQVSPKAEQLLGAQKALSR